MGNAILLYDLLIWLSDKLRSIVRDDAMWNYKNSNVLAGDVLLLFGYCCLFQAFLQWNTLTCGH